MHQACRSQGFLYDFSSPRRSWASEKAGCLHVSQSGGYWEPQHGQKARATLAASASPLALAGLVFESRFTRDFAIPQKRAICRVVPIQRREPGVAPAISIDFIRRVTSA